MGQKQYFLFISSPEKKKNPLNRDIDRQNSIGGTGLQFRST